MVSLTLAHDATRVLDLVKTVCILDRLEDCVPALKALHSCDAVKVLEVRDRIANPQDGWRDVTAWCGLFGLSV